MKRLVSIGEALIDFFPQKGEDENSSVSYLPVTGGAPLNVCAACAKLGGPASLISQVGGDAFGDQIIRDLEKLGVETRHISRTSEAQTSLAFVTLNPDGQRDFLFYRNPGADMLLGPEAITQEQFSDSFCLHFCSVSLGDFPMREAHRRAIELARDSGLLISFDPNLRFPLWEDRSALAKVIREFIPCADILKIASDELEFITGERDIKRALPPLFSLGPQLILYTRGADGAELYTKDHSISSEGCRVPVIDTTGAGDALAGSFLFQLARRGIGKENLNDLNSHELKSILDFSNYYAAVSIGRKGAAASYPSMDALET